MSWIRFGKTHYTFLLTFVLSTAFVNLVSIVEVPLGQLEKIVNPPAASERISEIKPAEKSGTGISGHSCNAAHIDCRSCKTCKEFRSANTGKPDDVKVSGLKEQPLRLISKPQPRYTDEAQNKLIEGETILKIVFLANGDIGSISPVTKLPYGLTENAIEAARRIKFEPAKKNGVPVSVVKSLKYTFTIY